MNSPSRHLLLRVNGIQPAFGVELGFNGPRANEVRMAAPYRRANVPHSLVLRKDGQVVQQTLIDSGMGVVPSPVEFEHTHLCRNLKRKDERHEGCDAHPHGPASDFARLTARR